MKNEDRNGMVFLLVVILTIIGYAIIHLYWKDVKTDISSGITVYENNRKKQPINNILAVKKDKPISTISPSTEPTIEPTIIPTNRPSNGATATPTIKPTAIPTIMPTSTPNNQEVNKNIVFEYDYDNGNYIYLVNQFPLKDEIGKSLQGEKRTNDFKLRFNGDATGVKYTITVEKMDDSDLDDEWVKMFLVNDGADVVNCYRSNNRVKTFNEYSKYKSNSKEKVIYEGIISSAEASRGYKDFTFRMWVSEDLKLENSDYLSQSKTFKTRINVYATENK